MFDHKKLLCKNLQGWMVPHIPKNQLGGRFKYFLCSSVLGEDEPILTSIFFKGAETTNQSLMEHISENYIFRPQVTLNGVFFQGIPPKSPEFRFRNYTNLPRTYL